MASSVKDDGITVPENWLSSPLSDLDNKNHLLTTSHATGFSKRLGRTVDIYNYHYCTDQDGYRNDRNRPVLYLVAHHDFVYRDDLLISSKASMLVNSPRADDRVSCYILYQLIWEFLAKKWDKSWGLILYVLFTDKEELGLLGADAFISNSTKQYVRHRNEAALVLDVCHPEIDGSITIGRGSIKFKDDPFNVFYDNDTGIVAQLHNKIKWPENLKHNDGLVLYPAIRLVGRISIIVSDMHNDASTYSPYDLGQMNKQLNAIVRTHAWNSRKDGVKFFSELDKRQSRYYVVLGNEFNDAHQYLPIQSNVWVFTGTETKITSAHQNGVSVDMSKVVTKSEPTTREGDLAIPSPVHDIISKEALSYERQTVIICSSFEGNITGDVEKASIDEFQVKSTPSNIGNSASSSNASGGGGDGNSVPAQRGVRAFFLTAPTQKHVNLLHAASDIIICGMYST